jgi:predicted nucleotidyltransferase
MLDDPDPKVRLKSIELIGKIADVGLFAERTEITINTKSTADLENELSKLLGDVIDVEATETVEEEEEEEGKNSD